LWWESTTEEQKLDSNGKELICLIVVKEISKVQFEQVVNNLPFDDVTD